MNRLIILFAVLLAACSPVRPRGDIALIAPESVPAEFVRLGDERVTAKACFPDNRVDVFSDEPIVREALDAALAKAPGATALADMTVEDETACVIVSGYPVRLASGAESSP
jgi:hypothetical protein